MTETSDRLPRRVRHETRRRTLTVSAVNQLTLGVRRIVLRSPELHDFVSAAPDGHIKLFITEDEKRDYTPRAFHRAAGELTIDFALHDAGPATDWAVRASVGDILEIGGPRGSMIVIRPYDAVADMSLARDALLLIDGQTDPETAR